LRFPRALKKETRRLSGMNSLQQQDPFDRFVIVGVAFREA